MRGVFGAIGDVEGRKDGGKREGVESAEQFPAFIRFIVDSISAPTPLANPASPDFAEWIEFPNMAYLDDIILHIDIAGASARHALSYSQRRQSPLKRIPTRACLGSPLLTVHVLHLLQLPVQLRCLVRQRDERRVLGLERRRYSYWSNSPILAPIEDSTNSIDHSPCGGVL